MNLNYSDSFLQNMHVLHYNSLHGSMNMLSYNPFNLNMYMHRLNPLYTFNMTYYVSLAH